MGRPSRRIILTIAGPCLLALLAAASALVCAQDIPRYTSKVRLVRMLVTVKDDNGKLIANLQKSDFKLLDNGARQEVAVFERHSSQPLSIALEVDISGSTAKDLKGEVIAVRKFLRDLFGEGNPEDQVKLWSFNWEVAEVTDFTRDLNLLDRRLDRLKAEAGTALYDAIYYGARSLEKREGRHVMVVVTDGGDTFSRTTYHAALEALHSADSVFYGILVMPILNDAGRNIGGENALIQMAASTGGRVFFPTGGHAIGDPLAEILKDLRTQYLLGFYPRNVPLSRNRFHTVKVELGRPGLRAVTRSGYYGDYEESAGRP